MNKLQKRMLAQSRIRTLRPGESLSLSEATCVLYQKQDEHHDKIRQLLDSLPEPTPEQLAALDERGDPKEWGVDEALKQLNEKE